MKQITIWFTLTIIGCLVTHLAFCAQEGPYQVSVSVSDAVAIESQITSTVTYSVDSTNYNTPDERTFTFYPYVFSSTPGDDVKLRLLPGSTDEYDTNNTWVNLLGVPHSPSTRINYSVEYTACGSSPPTYNLSDNDPASACSDHACTIPNEYANFFSCSPNPGSIKIIRDAMSSMPAAGTYEGTITFIASEA